MEQYHTLSTTNMSPTSSSNHPTGQAAASDGGNEIIKQQQPQQRDGTAAAAKESPRRRKRSGDKHKKKTNRRSRAERLEDERLLQESIRKYTRLLTVRENPEFFVLVQRRDFRELDELPEEPHTISEEEEDAEN